MKHQSKKCELLTQRRLDYSEIEAVKDNACEKILQGPQLAFKLIAKEKPFFHDLVLLKRC